MKIRFLIIIGIVTASVIVSAVIISQIDIYDRGKYHTVFGPGSPLAEIGTGNPVLNNENCERYANWLSKHQKEKISVQEDFSERYPPWGNQIFPLVKHCTSIGNLEKTVTNGVTQWSFSTNQEINPNYDEQESILVKAASLGINNVMEAIDSTDLSYDEKIEYIKVRHEAKGPDKPPSMNLRIKDLPQELQDGETPTFTLIESGYANPCTAPSLEVHLIRGERGLYGFSEEEPIFESRIVYSCPEFERYHPILNYWSEKDFPLFPDCRYDGVHVIVGDTGTHRYALDEYYCNGSKEFTPPIVHQITIPDGASDPNIAKNFEPSEIHLSYGDYVTFINKDDVRHRIIGDSARDPSPTSVEFVFYLEPNQFEQIKIIYDGEYWIRSEYPQDNDILPWMNATIYVD